MIQENPAQRPIFAKKSEDLTACLQDFGDFAEFEQKILQIAEVAGIDLNQFEIDHLAVRMNCVEKATQWRSLLCKNGQLLKESEVNGRPIGLFKLNDPLRFLGQSVFIIELPFPKGKIYPQEGWEHIEVVVPFLSNENVQQWTERVCKAFHLEENAHIHLKISEPKVEGERLPNPSIAISLREETNQNYCCLKLHPYNINAIISSEIIV